jgi:2,4-dienoyl-CoA reductase (NADPH2)
LQRSKGKPGDKLGKTTGWIHRAALKARGVVAAGDAIYRRIDDEGLHVTIGGEDKVIPADNVVICAGQEPLRDLYDALKGRGCSVHLIGGADVAAELDAKRAIDQGTRLAASI